MGILENHTGNPKKIPVILGKYPGYPKKYPGYPKQIPCYPKKYLGPLYEPIPPIPEVCFCHGRPSDVPPNLSSG